MDKSMLEIISGIILSESEQFVDVARKIWEQPELGFEEKFACVKQVELLSQLGFSVESPFVGLDTAYKAVRGCDGPTFCFAAEFREGFFGLW